jgi:hypothetical protein
MGTQRGWKVVRIMDNWGNQRPDNWNSSYSTHSKISALADIKPLIHEQNTWTIPGKKSTRPVRWESLRHSSHILWWEDCHLLLFTSILKKISHIEALADFSCNIHDRFLFLANNWFVCLSVSSLGIMFLHHTSLCIRPFDMSPCLCWTSTYKGFIWMY